MRSKSDLGKNPLCKQLIAAYRPLNPTEQAVATTDERIASVWPFMITRAAKFADSLKDRQRSNYDMEDVLTEIYLELRTKDSKFDASVATYVTFAATLADHLFVSIRDNSRTVHSPKNSGSRLHSYEESRAAGELTGKREATANKIRRTRCDFGGVEDQAKLECRSKPDMEAEDAEDRRMARNAVIAGLASLTPYEAAVTGGLAGLWGQPTMSVDAIVDAYGGCRDDVRDAIRSSKIKIRDHLLASGHTFVAGE